MAVTEFAARISRLSKQQPGEPKDIELWTYSHLGLRVGTESIRKALHGQVDPTQCAAELLMALTAYYGVTPAELGRFAEQRLQSVLAFAATMDPSPIDPSEQGIALDRCSTQPAGDAAVLTFVPRRSVAA